MVRPTSVDMPLSEIIKNKKTKKIVKKAGGIKKRGAAGIVKAGVKSPGKGTPRRQGGAVQKAVRRPVGGDNNLKRTVRINVSNLAHSVVSSDLRELFGEFQLRSVTVNFSENGQPLGTGDISLSKQNADRLIQKYAGVALDGKVMQFAVIEAANFANRTPVVTPNRRQSAGGKPARKVGNKKVPVGGAKQTKPAAAGAKKTTKPKREQKPKKTAEELDAELDAYMSRS